MRTQNHENILPQDNAFNLAKRELVERVQENSDIQDEELSQNEVSLESKASLENDAQHQLFAEPLGHKSKMTQADIYLSLALENDVSLSHSNELMQESLKKVQDQSKSVQAYSAYQEAQGLI